MSLALRPDRSPPGHPAALEHLADGIEHELALVTELRELLAAQRVAISACDAEAVQRSCDQVARTLQAMESAGRARSAVFEVLGVPSQTPLSALPEFLGDALPERLEAARTALRAAAEQTAAEASVHHLVLRRTVESGEAYLQALFSSATDPEPVYRTSERSAEGAAGFLLDRKA